MIRFSLAILLLISSLFSAIRDETQANDSVNQDMFPSSLNSVQTAFNKSASNENVVVFKYDPQTTYKVRLRTAVETMFVLPKDEKIISYSIGDSYIFNYKPILTKSYKTENLFTIRPQAAGVDTNLVIVGISGKIYNFYIRADNHESPFMPHFVVYVSQDGAIQNLGNLKSDKEKFSESGMPSLSHFVSSNVDVSRANFGYVSLSGGDKKLRPDSVFDDGRFTYFQFRDQPNKPRLTLPVVYRVVDGYDTPVNSRVEGEYIIVETTSDRWTLRAGKAHLCISKDER